MAFITLDWDLSVEGPGGARYVAACEFLLVFPSHQAIILNHLFSAQPNPTQPSSPVYKSPPPLQSCSISIL